MKEKEEEDSTKAIVNLVGASVLTKIFLLQRPNQKGSHQSDDVNPFDIEGEWEEVTPETIHPERWNLDLWDYVSLSFLMRKLHEAIGKKE